MSDLYLYRSYVLEVLSQAPSIRTQETKHGSDLVVYLLADRRRSWVTLNSEELVVDWGFIDIRANPPIFEGEKGKPASLREFAFRII